MKDYRLANRKNILNEIGNTIHISIIEHWLRKATFVWKKPQEIGIFLHRKNKEDFFCTEKKQTLAIYTKIESEWLCELKKMMKKEINDKIQIKYKIL